MIDALAGTLRRCVLLDINEELLRRSVDALADAYPRLAVQGIAGDFLRDLGEIGPGGDRLLAFLGSTIGNLHPSDEVPGFLARVARHLSPEGTFLLGLDLVKDKARLEAAYNDAAGLTAEFNRNILRVLNARFGADFEPADFEHVAFYDEREAWIEMRLRARRRLRARVPAAGVTLELAKGDEIRTEISCKYTRESLLARATGAGLALEAWFSDPDRLFALALMRPLPPPQR
jgi:L-histidine N-alpha-methyltransferase